MTARQVNPSPRAKKMRDLSPTPVVRANKKRGAATAPRISDARAALKNTSSAASASLISVDKPLTDKQRQFAKLWAAGDTIPNSTLRAGFADDGLGYRMARQPNILALYNKEKALYEEASQMTRKKVMDGFLEAIDMAKLMSEPASMISGWREIAKMCGYMAPVEHRMKVDVSGNIVLDRMNSMSDAELLKVISNGATPMLEGPPNA